MEDYGGDSAAALIGRMDTPKGYELRTAGRRLTCKKFLVLYGSLLAG